MKITNEWLRKHEACTEGYKWSQLEEERELKPFLAELVKDNHWDWANWVIVRVMNKSQKVQYAIFAAEQVIDLYEKKYPDDKRPREAIEAAKAYLDNPCAKTKNAASAYAAAANAAAAAAYAAYAAYAAAAAAYAAYAANAANDAAANAAAYSANAAYAAYDAANDAAANAANDAAANAATYAAAYARNKMRQTILDYGIGLIN